MKTFETVESKIIEALKQRDGKWTGLHVILLRFEKDEWTEAWKTVHRLVEANIIEKKAHIQYHELAKTPMGVFYLYRYIASQKPALRVVE